MGLKYEPYQKEMKIESQQTCEMNVTIYLSYPENYEFKTNSSHFQICVKTWRGVETFCRP